MHKPVRALAVIGGLVALLAGTTLSANASLPTSTARAAAHSSTSGKQVAGKGQTPAGSGRVTAADYAKRAVTAPQRKHAGHGKASAHQVQAAQAKAGRTSAPAMAGLAAAAPAAAAQAAATAAPAMDPGGRPDYFGNVPNYANSQMPTGGASVSIGDPTGTGATASATVANGVVTGVTVDNSGSGYTAPTITFGGVTGAGATGHATVVGGVTSVTIPAGGSGYLEGNPPAIAFSAPPAATGTTATGTAMIDSTGAVSGVTITDAGSGYVATQPPVVTVTSGTGSGASIQAVVSGTIDSITLDSGGSGYLLTGSGIRKFVDGLPGVGSAGTNNLGQYISVAHPDQKSFPGSDYYEIGLVEVQKKLHSDLPASTLRLYVQLNSGMNPDGSNVQPPDPPQYMGPMINSEAGRPVRVKFVNMLPTTQGAPCDRTTLPAQNATINATSYTDTAGCGNLFLPVDTNVMGAGMGPLGMPTGAADTSMDYTQNRATIHLHGGKTPWISDGTPHQWITPAGQSTAYPKGVSVSDVPDMYFEGGKPAAKQDGSVGTNDPGPGAETFYYTNQQSARMMFFHDHSYGITRLNVYAGEEAPYVIHDAAERAFTSAIADLKDDANTIPLVIQDKTFVPKTDQLAAEDPTWNAQKWGGQGNLWMPHVYMPNQNPANDNGAAPMGRWDYGPWFWPPYTGLKNPPVANPLYNAGCDATKNACENPQNPGFDQKNMDGTDGNVSQTMETFFDTMLVNGTPYPTKTVKQQVYRLRILNGSNDRHLNLSLFYAKSNATMWNKDGSLNNADAGEVPTMDATTAAINDPLNNCSAAQKATWPHDGRDGGVPTCSAAGPDMVQIGNDGGFLPAPAPISSQPIDYEYNRRNIIVLDVLHHGLLLAPAERADVLVDFSKVPAGAKLVLYNDSPAADPAIDPRNDYYTGDGDQTGSGGAPSTQPGFGPDTRTVMQFQVDGSAPSAGLDLAALPGTLSTAYQADQPAPIVPQLAYKDMTLPAGYDWNFNGTGTASATPVDPQKINATSNNYTSIADTSKTFTPVGGTGPVTVAMQPKAIQELFDTTWGRMTATLGAELPNTSANTQTTVPLGYAEPANEVMDPHKVGTQIQTLGDGTQIWKITHNGVDSHPVHFHLFDVQLINRVGWDGAKYAPDANELGWKDTVLMHPLEDTIVAMRPQVPTLPFKIPNSIRPIDPTMPIGSPIATFNTTTGQAISVPNALTDYGWEYVWHCHMLSHEEMDFMRPVIVHGAPPVPTAVAGSPGGTTVGLTWTQPGIGNPAVTNYTLQRSTSADFTTGVTTVVDSKSTPPVTATAFTDTGLTQLTRYWYRVRSESQGGYSAWSSVVAVQTVLTAPTVDVAIAPVTVGGTTRYQNTVTWAAPATTGLPAGVTVGTQLQRSMTSTFSGTPLPVTGTTYPEVAPAPANATTRYQVRFLASTGAVSAWSGILAVAAAPGKPTATTTQGPPGIALTWTAPSNPGTAGRPPVTGYQVQRATDTGFTAGLQTTPTTGMSYSDTTPVVGTTYSYRVRATYAGGISAWSGTTTTAVVAPVAPPTSLVATPVQRASDGRYQTTLTWTNGAPYTGVQVQRSLTLPFSGTNGLTQLTGSPTSWTDVAVDPGTTVYYQVRGMAGTTSSSWTTVTALAPGTPLPPARPGLTAGAGSFTASLAPSGTMPVTDYLVSYRTGSGATTTVTVPANGNPTAYTVTGLVRRATYTVTVVARNAVGSSPPTVSRTVTTL